MQFIYYESRIHTGKQTSPSLLGPDQAVNPWGPSINEEQLWAAVPASSPSAKTSLPLTL